MEALQSLGYHPSFAGVFVQLFVIILITFILRASPQGGFSLLFKGAVEKLYDFLYEILGTEEKKRIISLMASIFFVVLIANLLGLAGDIIGYFVTVTPEYAAGLGVASGESLFKSFSADNNATTALALIIVVLSVLIQFTHLGPIKFFNEYIPLTGKGFFTVKRGKMSALVFYPLRLAAKVFDIVISLFIGLLDIIGIFAKIISLSFRLRGNMLSGTILLGILTAASIALSQSIASIDFPVVIPVILWIQGLLVALVQAFVVTLLGSIYIKVAKT